MTHHQLLSTCTLLFLAVCSQPVCAQLFGDTSLNPNRARRNMGSAEELSITVQEKFLRGNRDTDDFVGAASSGESRFIGVGPAVPTGADALTSAVTGLTEEVAPPVNVPRTKTAAGIYDPKLTIGFEYRRPDRTEQRPASARPNVVQDYAASRGLSLVFSPDGTSANLRGTVQSSEHRRLAELIVLFEPGIETVVNELNVAPTEAH